jgi:hypothetical protein
LTAWRGFARLPAPIAAGAGWCCASPLEFISKFSAESWTMRCAILLGAFVCGWGLIGCGGDSGSRGGQAATQGAGATTANKPQPIPADATPDIVVQMFLDSLRGGDQATTSTLLTKKALAETSKRNLSVCPQATPHMIYDITKAEVQANDPNLAYVHVIWTEKYTDGDVTYEVVWGLRKQAEGWRIAGMAIELVPGQGQAYLNFEDPDDMIRKQEEAMAALQAPAAETAALPMDKTGSFASPGGEPQPNALRGESFSPPQNFGPPNDGSPNLAPQNPSLENFAPQNFAPQDSGLGGGATLGDPVTTEAGQSSPAFPLPASKPRVER